MSLPSLLRSHPRVLLFGAGSRLVGGVGQTFFVSLFVPSFTAALALDRTGFASLYGGATLAAGLTLPLVGRLIDRVRLARFAVGVSCGLALACLGLAHASGIAFLGFALFLLRLFGQGLMTHTAVTTLTRYFVRSRATALGMSFLGHATAEAAFPLLATATIASAGWRAVWWAAAGLALAFAGFTALAFRGEDTSPQGYSAREAPRAGDAPASAGPSRSSWTRLDYVTDPRVWALTPLWLSPAFVLTGMFLHQLTLADEKGWSAELLASTFIGYAAVQTAVSFLGGPLVDRVGARRLLPIHMLPLAAGLLVLFVASSPIAAWLYMGLAALSMGLAVTVRAPWLVDIVGTEHLGGIRSLQIAVAVLSTSVSPPLFSVILDAGVPFADLCAALAAGLVVVSLLGTVAMRALERDPRPRRARRGVRAP